MGLLAYYVSVTSWVRGTSSREGLVYNNRMEVQNNETNITNDVSRTNPTVGTPNTDIRASEHEGVITPSGLGNALTFPCQLDGCLRRFSTKSGLGLHRLRAHPVWYNEQINTMRSRPRWSEEECRLMAAIEAEMLQDNPTMTLIHVSLQSRFQHRTVEAIRKRRQTPQYREMLQVARSELQSNVEEDVTEPHEPVADEPESIDDGLTPLIEVLQKEPGESAKKLLRLIQKFYDGRLMELDLVNWVKGATASTPLLLDQRRQQHHVAHSSTSPPLSSAQRRRQKYAKLQKLWDKSESKAAKSVLDPLANTPDRQVDPQVMLDTWSDLLSRPAGRIERTVPQESGDLASIWSPITIEDIQMNEVRFSSAPGLDGVTVSAWRRISAVCRAAFYNLVRGLGRYPAPLSTGRTIFIPKVPGTLDPLEHRPLTIPPVGLRQFHKIIAGRILKSHQWDDRQFAFLPQDGVAENLMMLDALINSARSECRELHIGSLDISKAFDSIEHSAIFEALARHGAPDAFLEYLRTSYGNMSTVLQFAGCTRTTAVTRGVRQGDPMSPMMFNLKMEHTLRTLDPGIGYNLTLSRRISASCFADDERIYASTKQGLQRNMDRTRESLADAGLEFNPNKMSVLSLKPSGRQKKVKVLTSPQLYVDGQAVKQLGVLDYWKTLGVEYAGTRLQHAGAGYGTFLDRISKACLKPQQKVTVLTRYLIPRYLHSLVLGRMRKQSLEKLDVLTRAAVRRWLHLPHDLPLGFFHAPIATGGLGIPAFVTRIPILRIRRLARMAESENSVIAEISRTDIAAKKIQSCCNLLNLRSTIVPANFEEDFWKNKLHSSVDGRSLTHMADVKESTQWLRSNGRNMSGSDFIGCVQTLSGCLPTKSRTTRGREMSNQCRAGCLTPETNYHVIQTCPRTHCGRVLRHDKLCNIITSMLEQNGFVVYKEPRLKTRCGPLYKPDIVVRGNNKVYVVDVHIITHDRMQMWYEKKKRKYMEANGFEASLLAFLDLPSVGTNIEYFPVTVGYKGVLYLPAMQALSELKFTKRQIAVWSKVALFGSYLNFRTFMNSTQSSQTISRNPVGSFVPIGT